MILARHLSKKEIGVWALFTIITTTFEFSKGSLLKAAHIRLVTSSPNENEKNKISWSSLTMNSLLTFLFILFILLFSNKISTWLNTEKELSNLFYLYIPGLISMIFLSHYEAVLVSYLNFKGLLIGTLARLITFSSPILYYFLLQKELSLEKLMILNIISIIIGTLSLFIICYKYLTFSFQVNKSSIEKILKFGTFVFGTGVVSNIASNIDQLLTSNYLNPISVSYYNTASRLNGFVEIPSYAAADVLFPKFSQLSVEENQDKINRIFEKSIAVILSIMIPIAICLIIFSKYLILIIAGPSFESSNMILRIYIVCSVIAIIQNQSANMLTSIGRAKTCFYTNTTSFIIKIILAYIFLSYFGFYGAALATIVMTIVNFIIWYFIMKRYTNINFFHIIPQIKLLYQDFYTKSYNVAFKKRSD
jgi:O-antigen/teichoic acid export membrane protein